MGPLESNMVRSSRFHFAAVFTLTCIAFYAIIQALPPSFIKPINEHTAFILGLVLNALGIHASTANDTVSEGGLAFRLIPECTPIFTVGLFISFVVFYPTTFREKATGLAWVIPALYLGNLVRLVVTFLVSRYDRSLFEVFHVFLGQIFTMLLLILCCILWLRWVDTGVLKREKAMGTARFLASFSLISAFLFLIWLKVHHEYIRLLDWLMNLGFSLFGRSAGLARGTLVYYETFSIVIVVSLILAARSVPWRRKIPMLGAGLGLLFLIHLFHRIDNALMALYNITAIQPLDLTGLIIGQYVVPVLLLIYLVRLQRQDVPTVNAFNR
ncbi:MAG TPA: exosortase/archaeosortase family protein [Nitrospirota bacterium]|nr:exosortase/archaeosortase family protein [Nitrospirota bacterium]